MLDESGGLCLVPLVKSMREQRHPWMVEGEAQYKLAYDTVIHLLLEITDNWNKGFIEDKAMLPEGAVEIWGGLKLYVCLFCLFFPSLCNITNGI